MVTEAGEAQAVMVQLEQVIASTGGAAGVSAEDVNALAKSFADITVYEDDAILGAQTLLLQFDNINKVNLGQATDVMTDLATRLHTDLPNAAKLLGRALSGELGGLSRYGIIIDDQTQKNIQSLLKMGQTAEATQIILDAISGKVGGAAEAEAKTFTGLLARIKKDCLTHWRQWGTRLLKILRSLDFLKSWTKQ